MKPIKIYIQAKRIFYVLLGSFILAIGLNYFYFPANLYGGGVTGIAMIIGHFTNGYISFSTLYLIVNAPLLLLSWFKLGRSFTFYTVISVVSLSFFTALLPTIPLISTETLLMSVYGGIIIGIAVTVTLKGGGCSGGSDVISIYLSDRFNGSMGTYALIINVSVLSAVAAVFDLETALYTVIATYITSSVIDKLHTRYKKLTVTVNTNYSKEIIEKFQENSPRGITIIPAIGAYTNQPRDLLYIVITSYELSEFKNLVRKIDKNAFINITKSEGVFGNFKKIK